MKERILLLLIDIVFGVIGGILALWACELVGFEKVAIILLVMIFLKIERKP